MRGNAVKNERIQVEWSDLKIEIKSFEMNGLQELSAGRQSATLHLVFAEILRVEALEPLRELLGVGFV